LLQTGKTYYHNSITNATSWDVPAGFNAGGGDVRIFKRKDSKKIAPDVVCAIGIISLTIISLYLSPFSFPLSLSLSLIRQHQEKKRL
jgi:hypothetical protein